MSKSTDNIKKFLKGQSKTNIDKQHNKCRYCKQHVYSTGDICSRKTCIRTRRTLIPKYDKHGTFIANYNEKMIERDYT